jgi:S-adenosylmethionine decarboxylase
VIDVRGCDLSAVSSADVIRRFLVELVPALGMLPQGDPIVKRFGEGDLEGWSAVQFIETSSITLHADEVKGRCFIDVFSCKSFDAEIAASLAQKAFHGRSVDHSLIERR